MTVMYWWEGEEKKRWQTNRYFSREWRFLDPIPARRSRMLVMTKKMISTKIKTQTGPYT